MDSTADLCICPSESVISCWTSDKGDKALPVAVAAVLQDDYSAIVSPSAAGVKSPRELDGRKYASYGGRFEIAIVQQLIKNDGGLGKAIEEVPPKLNCFAEMINGNCAATWVSMGWEGIEARRSGHDLNVFKISDFDVPYGHSPLVLAHPRLLEGDGAAALRAFLKATAVGFEAAAADAETAVDILQNTGVLKLLGHNENLDREFLLESQSVVSKRYLDADGEWGRMEWIRSAMRTL
jgi:ABC-type nitrate/sulfonate/bicarbonate transport system substrate-binding protein